MQHNQTTMSPQTSDVVAKSWSAERTNIRRIAQHLCPQERERTFIVRCPLGLNLFRSFYITQRTAKEMLKQKSGCVVGITAALADWPIACENGLGSMLAMGSFNAAT
jgi:hypothetical protein